MSKRRSSAVENAQKVELRSLIKALLKQAHMTIEMVVIRMAKVDPEVFSLRDAFHNNFTTRLANEPRVPYDLLRRFVQVLRSDTLIRRNKRISRDQASQLAHLSNISLKDYERLLALFDDSSQSPADHVSTQSLNSDTNGERFANLTLGV